MSFYFPKTMVIFVSASWAALLIQYIGHLVTAEEARQQFKLDHVVFMPTGNPPHKDRTWISDAEHRYV